MTETFHPTGWSEAQLREAAEAQGLPLPEACLPGVTANLALLENRWATLEAALAASGEAP